MNIRMSALGEALRANYWLVPALMMAGAIAFAWAGVAFDKWLQAEDVDLPGWVYAGGAEGAHNVLSAIVTAMMSVTSVVFSITIVALTLASSQFGPRLLRNFMRDQGSQFALGTFVATFIYSVLVLRTIRSGDGAFVPQVSATAALALTIFATAVLIYFIHHIAEQIQAERVVCAVDDDLRETMNRLRSEEPQESGAQIPDNPLPNDFAERCECVRVERGNYVEGIDYGAAVKLATRENFVIRFTHKPGAFVPDGGGVAEVYPGENLSSEVTAELRAMVVLGRSRTPTQDVEYGILQLTEVAVRSLSPGINDPFTAVACVDRLGSALRRLAEWPNPVPVRFDDTGKVRVIVTTTDFDGHVAAAFNQIRQNAGQSAAVLIRIVESLTSIAEVGRRSDQRETLRRQADMVMDTARRNLPQKQDVADIETRYRTLIETLDSDND